VWEASPAGPFDRWPSPGNGFEYFYGFLGGETNQWYPALHEGTAAVAPDRTPAQGYHLMADLADRGIAWVRQQKALTPDRPFFMYFAPGATHTPHHVPKEWADNYKGQFDDGWDALREQTFARQPRDLQLEVVDQPETDVDVAMRTLDHTSERGGGRDVHTRGAAGIDVADRGEGASSPPVVH
jgi:arylsulfatase A-like enzyme